MIDGGQLTVSIEQGRIVINLPQQCPVQKVVAPN